MTKRIIEKEKKRKIIINIDLAILPSHDNYNKFFCSKPFPISK